MLYLFDGLSFALGLAEPSTHMTAKWYAIRGAFEMVVGLFVMRGIPMFLDLAFPPDEPPKDKHDETKPDA